MQSAYIFLHVNIKITNNRGISTYDNRNHRWHWFRKKYRYADTIRVWSKVISADKIAREVVMPGMEAYNQIVRTFGEGILDEDGNINRKSLGILSFPILIF